LCIHTFNIEADSAKPLVVVPAKVSTLLRKRQGFATMPSRTTKMKNLIKINVKKMEWQRRQLRGEFAGGRVASTDKDKRQGNEAEKAAIHVVVNDEEEEPTSHLAWTGPELGRAAVEEAEEDSPVTTPPSQMMTVRSGNCPPTAPAPLHVLLGAELAL
jgi:hypothetical protein